MAARVLITGHGKYASGLLDAINLLSGENNNFTAIDFSGDVKSYQDALTSKLEEMASEKDTNILVVCDLFGGTPFRTAARISRTRANVAVASGINLPGLFHAAFEMNTASFSDLCNDIIKISKQSIMLYEKAGYGKHFPTDSISGSKTGI